MITWLQGTESASCFSCGSAGPHDRVLRAAGPDGASPATLLRCASCAACFFADATIPEYTAAPAEHSAALAFYLQQGADAGGMAARLASLGRPPGTRYLEIGCGFGFGLDIARRALGWHVRGFDPSPFAAAGRALLDLPIESAMFDPAAIAGEQYDVIHASELLEHVATPAALLRDFAAVLAPGGTLLLTTPAAEAIDPATSPGLLVPLLSVGWHVTIQTASSLDRLLRQAGLENVAVTRHGAQLVAFAGQPLGPPPSDRAVVRAWLGAAADAVAPVSDLGLGLRARAFREAMSAEDFAAAEAHWRALDDAVRDRFGRAIESWADAEIAEPADLSELVGTEPLNLGPVLLHRSWQLQREPAPSPARYRALLAATIDAVGRLRRALRRIGSDDGDAESIGQVAILELLQAEAADHRADFADRIDALTARAGHTSSATIRMRVFVQRMQAGDEAAAAQLVDVAAPARTAILRPASREPLHIETLYHSAQLALRAAGGDLSRAAADFALVRDAVGRGDLPGFAPLLRPTLEAEARALRRQGRWWEAARRQAMLAMLRMGGTDPA